MKRTNYANRRTNEEKIAIVEKVKDLVASGMTVKDSCKQVNVAMSNYYTYAENVGNKKTKKPVNKPTPLTYEKIAIKEDKQDKKNHMYMFYGPSDVIASFLKAYEDE